MARMKGKGQLFCLKVVVRCSSSSRFSFRRVTFLALSKRLLTAALFSLAGWWELKCRHLSVFVGFLKTVTSRASPSLRVSLVLRKGKGAVPLRLHGELDGGAYTVAMVE